MRLTTIHTPSTWFTATDTTRARPPVDTRMAAPDAMHREVAEAMNTGG